MIRFFLAGLKPIFVLAYLCALSSCSDNQSSSEGKTIIGLDDRVYQQETHLSQVLGRLRLENQVCNAFVTGSEEITTAAHCLKGANSLSLQRMKFELFNGSSFKITRILAHSDSKDFVRLKVSRALGKSVVIGKFDPNKTATLISVSSSGTDFVSSSCGSISDIDGFLYHDCDSVEGNSGSPLFQDGAVVGMHFGYSKSHALNVALDLSKIHDDTVRINSNDIVVESCWAGCVASTVGGAITGGISGFGSLLPTGPAGAAAGAALGGVGGALLGAAAGGCFTSANQCVESGIDKTVVDEDATGTQTQNFFSGDQLVGWITIKPKSVGIREGWFKVGLSEDIYWSNGINAYCWVTSPTYVDGPVVHHEFDVHKATSFERHPACPGQ